MFLLCLPKTRTPFLNPLVLEKGVLGRALSKTRLVPYRSLGLTSNSIGCGIGCGVPATHNFAVSAPSCKL